MGQIERMIEMNKVVLMGRLCAEPDVRYTQNENGMCIARYRLAVDRRFKREGDEQTADFISCVAFGKAAEFVEKYLQKGTKIAVVGRIQTGSYTNQNGQVVYTTDVVVEEQEFAESKSHSSAGSSAPSSAPQNTGVDADGFMKIPDDISDEGLPFN